MDREIKQELQDRIYGKIMATTVVGMIQMVFETDKTDESAKRFMKQLEDRAKKAAEETLALVLATVDAGKIPQQAA